MKKSIFIAVLSILLVWTGLHIGVLVHAQTSTPGSINGLANQAIGMSGVQPFYDSSGSVITNGRCVQAPVTSAATTGQWTLNYSALGFTAITKASAQAVSPTSSQTLIANQYMANINSVSTTTMTGTVTTPTTLTILGATLLFGASATTVYAGVCGT